MHVLSPGQGQFKKCAHKVQARHVASAPSGTSIRRTACVCPHTIRDVLIAVGGQPFGLVTKQTLFLLFESKRKSVGSSGGAFHPSSYESTCPARAPIPHRRPLVPREVTRYLQTFCVQFFLPPCANGYQGRPQPPAYLHSREDFMDYPAACRLLRSRTLFTLVWICNTSSTAGTWL